MADIEFYLDSPLGRQLLATDGGGPVGLTDRTLGFGITPRKHRWVEGAGEGAQRRNTRVGARSLDLGVIFEANSRLELDGVIRQFGRLITPYNPDPMLTAEYGSGEKYSLSFVYNSGLEIDHSDVVIAEGSATYRTVLSLTCKPYWVSQTPATEEFRIGTSRGMLPKLGYLRMMNTEVVGTRNIVNPGDVDAYPIWRIYGPVTSATITTVRGTFVYNAAVLAGSVITIDTESGTVVDQTGASKYINLGPAPKLAKIPSGTSSVSVNAPGATTDTRITMEYKNRREVIV